MERLTERDGINIIVKEDYGEKVLRTVYGCFGEKPTPHYTNCEEGYCAMEKLEQYEDLEEQGLLAKLPCKPFDNAYVIPTKENGLSDITAMLCIGFAISHDSVNANLANKTNKL